MTQQRINVSTGTVWESVVGYSRVVRVGQTVVVCGTTATGDNGEIVGIGDPYTQTIFIISKIERALAQVGVTLEDVIRTRIFVTDISQWEAIGRAHGEFFSVIRPACTMVQVAALVDPRHLVEIEMDALARS